MELTVKQPIYWTTEGTNTRKAKCNRCKVTLSKGEGIAWDYREETRALFICKTRKYYCPTCTRIEKIEQTNRMIASRYLDEIKKQLSGMVMAWQAHDSIMNKSFLLSGSEAVMFLQAVNDRLETAELNYSNVIDISREEYDLYRGDL